MKERVLYINRGIITTLFLIIMGGVMVNSTFFLHTHRNESGKIVFHAHPFDKGAERDDPLAKHSHCKIDLDYLSSFEQYTLFESVLHFEYKGKVELELFSKPILTPFSNVYCLFTTRGPPQVLILG